jgi:hypothetical protein
MCQAQNGEKKSGLAEQTKTKERSLIAGRIRLFQEVIAKGIEEVLAAEGQVPSAESIRRSEFLP